VLGLPVEQAGSIEEVLELGVRHSRVLRERRGWEPAHHPRHDARVDPSGGLTVGGLHGGRPIRRNIASVAGVLGSRDRDQPVAVLERVDVDRGGLGDHVERRVPEPVAVVDEAAAEREPDERVRAALPQMADHRLDQRPCERHAPDDHLLAGLDAEARVDQEGGVALDTWIGHGERC
jgi:hypothetical protein